MTSRVADALRADLLGATLVDAQDELWAAWAALERAGYPENALRWMNEPPPWPPASIATMMSGGGEHGMAMMETLAGQLAPEPSVRSWLVRSWLSPSRLIDEKMLDELRAPRTVISAASPIFATGSARNGPSRRASATGAWLVSRLRRQADRRVLREHRGAGPGRPCARRAPYEVSPLAPTLFDRTRSQSLDWILSSTAYFYCIRIRERLWILPAKPLRLTSISPRLGPR